jgi:hypothetical protein
MSDAVGMSFAEVRALALALPEVEEGVAFGTPAFRVRKTLLARLREDGETMMVKADYAEREFRIAAQPEVFFITDHYKNYPALLVRLAQVHPAEMQVLLGKAWRMIAPKRLLKQHGS